MVRAGETVTGHRTRVHKQFLSYITAEHVPVQLYINYPSYFDMTLFISPLNAGGYCMSRTL
jgi:hypothetical protein